MTDLYLYAINSKEHTYALSSQVSPCDIDHPEYLDTHLFIYHPDDELDGISRSMALAIMWHNQDSEFLNPELSQSLIRFIIKKPPCERFLLVDDFYQERFLKLGHKSTYVEYDSLGN